MLSKSPAIVLHQIKYTDTGVIVQAFTRNFGRISFLVKGIRSKKSGKFAVHLQPLTILDVVLYYREARSIQSLKEYSVSFSPAGIQTDISKSSMAIFLGEVLTNVLREESPQAELFDFLSDAIRYLDSRKEGFANFHIAFLCALSGYLGFSPSPRKNEEDIFFDLREGRFMPLRPSHGEFESGMAAGALSYFFRSSWDEMNTIALTGTERNEILSALLRYYSTHLPAVKKIRSADILREVFG